MVLSRLRTPALILAAALGAAGCTDGYGYSGVSVGVGSGYYGDDYYGGGYYGSGYGSPYWGWYNGFYYPGTGIYVYDQYRRPHRWNDYQRRYWSDRRGQWGQRFRNNPELRENWRDFRQDRRTDERAFRQDRRIDRQALRDGNVTREQFRTERREDRREYRQERRQDVREFRRENRQDLRGNRPGAGVRSGVRGMAPRATGPRAGGRVRTPRN